jgi:hypothetical protein
MRKKTKENAAKTPKNLYSAAKKMSKEQRFICFEASIIFLEGNAKAAKEA